MTQSNGMTSMERVLTTLGFKEPDRVPWFPLLTMTGARELGLSIREYFSSGKNVAEGQLRMWAKYGHDCLYAFFYAPVEIEAWGGEVIYAEDGPPNSGEPFLSNPEEIPGLEPPQIEESPCLLKVLDAIEKMKREAGDEVPIIGVVMSPFSLPVMQMGFDRYLDLLSERPDLFRRLMEVNEAFTVSWANAQLNAGAVAICYFDPVSSSTIVPRKLFLETGFPVARRTISRIKGPVAVHFASGRCLSLLDDLAETGALIAGVSAEESLRELKRASRGRLTLLGNLNGLEMRRWSSRQAEDEVKKAISAGGPGGGFILSDNHGEIPWQVSDEILFAMRDAVRTWGGYPLDWIG